MTKEKFFNLLNVEIANIIEPLQKIGVDVDRMNVIDEIMGDHKDDLLSDFATYCGRFTVTDSVTRFFRKNFKNDEEKETEQLSFEGFSRVQKYYSIVRNDLYLAVPVDSLTEEEVYSIANELRKKSKGLEEHAKQLVDFYFQITKANE